jgi:hypothetical protein
MRSAALGTRFGIVVAMPLRLPHPVYAKKARLTSTNTMTATTKIFNPETTLAMFRSTRRSSSVGSFVGRLGAVEDPGNGPVMVPAHPRAYTSSLGTD